MIFVAAVAWILAAVGGAMLAYGLNEDYAGPAITGGGVLGISLMLAVLPVSGVA